VNHEVRASRLGLNLMSLTRRKSHILPPGAIRFDQGDPHFNTPQPIRSALAAAVEAGIVHYSDPEGDPELRSAVASNVSSRSARCYGDEQVLITHGATGALTAAILGTLNPGDSVLIPEPSYSLYSDLVHMAGAQPVYVPCPPPEFRLDLAAMESLARHARLVVLCHPCNPTGTVYTRDEIEAVADIAARHNLLVLSDEAYDHIVYEPTNFTSALDVPVLADRLLYVQSFSKTYAMTGWRLGYLLTPPDLQAVCGRIHRTLVGPINSAVQRAALEALAHGDEWHAAMLREYRERRDMVVDALQSRADSPVGPPQGTFYILAPHPGEINSEDMAQLALEYGVAVRPGSEYGPSGEGFLRIAFSLALDEVQEGMARLGRAFESVPRREPLRARN
jgi:aspartate aminotransferase